MAFGWLKKVAKIGLPILGATTLGPLGGIAGGALGGLIGGGGVKGALTGAALGGIGGGALKGAGGLKGLAKIGGGLLGRGGGQGMEAGRKANYDKLVAAGMDPQQAAQMAIQQAGGGFGRIGGNVGQLAQLGLAGAGMISGARQSAKAGKINDQLLQQAQAEQAQRNAMQQQLVARIGAPPVSSNPFMQKVA